MARQKFDFEEVRRRIRMEDTMQLVAPDDILPRLDQELALYQKQLNDWGVPRHPRHLEWDRAYYRLQVLSRLLQDRVCSLSSFRVEAYNTLGRGEFSQTRFELTIARLVGTIYSLGGEIVWASRPHPR